MVAMVGAKVCILSTLRTLLLSYDPERTALIEIAFAQPPFPLEDLTRYTGWIVPCDGFQSSLYSLYLS